MTAPTTPERVPFPVVDEVARHCLQEEEPETVHIEVHLPGRLDPTRLRKAFTQALQRHPRILMREAAGPWYRRRYEWELTETPDVEVVTFLPAGSHALQDARTRALTKAPPLSMSPPIRLEVVEDAGPAEGSEAMDAVGEATAEATGPEPDTATSSHAAGAHIAAGSRAAGAARVGDGGAPARARSSVGEAPCQRGQAHPPPAHGNPAHSKGTVLCVTINHTALDGPACLRVLATAAELYGGRDNSPAAPPVRFPRTPQEPADVPSNWSRPARVAPGTPEPSPGNSMLVTELPLPHRPKGSPYTVNDQLMVTTALTIAHWNREHGAHPRPLRITMPVDDRPRDTTMPIGNGTRLVEVPFAPDELTNTHMPSLLRRTAERTRALKSLPRPQLGHGAALLTAPWAPVGCRAALTRVLRRAAAPWTSTTLLSNIGRIPYPLDFGEDAGRAHAVWFSAPARMPRGLTVTTASTAGRLHLALRWSRALLSHGDGAHLRDLFEHYLHTTETTQTTEPAQRTEPTEVNP
ncbi:condensation protein [Streptomyces sp. TRM68367]|uniref:condensation protein n=1 Tax=Streptomyces sp. TRM68367 TaxID=2758415 RepID=UPI00165B19ED|nr:condensation protein [Streptomyces sp. TRM68367]MBC9724165.1 condensation protein [Streptomyces sp. TRM68367]